MKDTRSKVAKILEHFEREKKEKNRSLQEELCQEIELRQTKIGRLLVNLRKPSSGN
jgi:hypothetical protein